MLVFLSAHIRKDVKVGCWDRDWLGQTLALNLDFVPFSFPPGFPVSSLTLVSSLPSVSDTSSMPSEPLGLLSPEPLITLHPTTAASSWTGITRQDTTWRLLPPVPGPSSLGPQSMTNRRLLVSEESALKTSFLCVSLVCILNEFSVLHCGWSVYFKLTLNLKILRLG